MKTMKIIAILVFVGLIAAEASASSQRFEWTGRVERIYDELGHPTTIPGIEVGDVFLGTILYDTDRFGPGVGSDSHRDYAAPSGLTMTLTFEGEFCCSRVITGVSVGGAVTYDQWNWMSGGSVFFQANDYSNSSFFPPPIPVSFSEMHTLFVNNLYKFTAAPKFSINFGVPSKQYRIYLDQQFFSFGGHGFQGIPNVVGMTLDEARFAISDAGFVVWSITYANSNTVPQGNVISQDPAAGTEVLLGTNVDLVISSGPSGGPGVGGLVGHWKLDETSGTIAADSSGNGNNGTLYGGPIWQPTGGKIGGTLKLDGVNDYAQLPIGSLIGSLTNSTFATWVNWSGTGGLWQRVFDFGSSDKVYMYLTPRSLTTNGPMRFTMALAGWEGHEDSVIAQQSLPSGWHHVAVVIDAVNRTYSLYFDGHVVAQKTNVIYLPSDLGNTTQNWLGRSQYASDAYFNGSLDDVRIYSRVLSESEIQAAMTGIVLPLATGNIIWVSDAHQTLAGSEVPDDQGWVDLLRSNGYNVDYQPPTAPATGYWRTLDAAKLAALDAADLIIVSRDAGSLEHANDATEVTQWNNIKTPLILLQVWLARNNRWLWINSTNMSQRQAYFTAKAVDLSHPVFTGVNLDAQKQVVWLDQNVYPGYSSYINTTIAGNGKIIAVRPDNNYVVIAEWSAGTSFYAGSTQTPAEKRMLFCAGTEQTSDTSVGWGVYDLTAEGAKMFFNAVAYMIGEGGAAVTDEIVIGDFEQSMEAWGPTWETPAPAFSYSTTGVTLGQRSLAIKPNKNGFQWSFMYTGLVDLETYKKLSVDVTWVAAEWGATPWCNFKEVVINSDGPSGWKQYIPNDTVNPDWPGSWDPVGWGNHTRILTWDFSGYNATGATWMQIIFSTNFGGSTPGKYYIDNVRLISE